MGCRAARPGTLEQYQRAATDSVAWAARRPLDWRSAADLDAVLAQYFTELFDDGCDPAAGAALVAALRHLLPGLVGRGVPLPRAGRALKGWRQLAPAAFRATK